MPNPYPVEITDAQGEARLTGEAVFTDPGNQPGGGSSPGVGDFMCADVSTPISCPNNGATTAIVFDDGILAGGAGDVTLNVDNTTLEFATPGHYQVNAYASFDITDPTGDRSIGMFNLTGMVAGSNASAESGVSPGGSANGVNGNAAISWSVQIGSGGGSLQLGARVHGAAGAVMMNYGFVTAVKVAALGH